MDDPCATATVHIDARPDVVYGLIADLQGAGGGCRGTEGTWDRRHGWFRKLAGKATGVGDRVAANTEHIRVTLQRLKQRAEAG
jgi:hypothetical protein